MAGTFTYTVDWGDGTPAVTVDGPADPPITHTYTAPGTYTMSATATDPDGAISDPLPFTITVTQQAATTTTTTTHRPPPHRPPRRTDDVGGANHDGGTNHDRDINHDWGADHDGGRPGGSTADHGRRKRPHGVGCARAGRRRPRCADRVATPRCVSGSPPVARGR